MVGLETDIKSIIDSLLSKIHSIPLKNNNRNQKLRETILKTLAGLLLTDDERAEYMGLPKGCRIRESAKILSPEKLIIGEHCWIGENVMLDASGGLEIGSHTSIGSAAQIWTHSSHLSNISLNNYPGSQLIKRKPTKIGSGCLICGPSVVLAGVTIGDRVVVRPMSLVASDIPDRALVDRDTIHENVWTEELIKELIDEQLRSA